jgi:hypothetical protein
MMVFAAGTDLTFPEMFKSSVYQDVSLSEGRTHTSAGLVVAHRNMDTSTRDGRVRSRGPKGA